MLSSKPISTPSNLPDPDRGAQGPCAPHLGERLKISEWIFLIFILMMITAFIIISKQTSFRHLNRIEAPRAIVMLHIEVTGCVQRGAVFDVPEGTSLRTVLRKARPKPLSDLSGINLDQPLHASLLLHIPQLQQIEVQVEGCVLEKVSLQMPIGSRICDLSEQISPLPDADLTFFKRRRKLKNHELICVPRRGLNDIARN